ncbi:MAG: hypothetical protein FJZ61_04305 [Chlamydiae bacterium]|nr:hypothetical protein [Chlamydiota bacterium]
MTGEIQLPKESLQPEVEPAVFLFPKSQKIKNTYLLDRAFDRLDWETKNNLYPKEGLLDPRSQKKEAFFNKDLITGESDPEAQIKKYLPSSRSIILISEKNLLNVPLKNLLNEVYSSKKSIGRVETSDVPIPAPFPQLKIDFSETITYQENFPPLEEKEGSLKFLIAHLGASPNFLLRSFGLSMAQLKEHIHLIDEEYLVPDLFWNSSTASFEPNFSKDPLLLNLKEPNSEINASSFILENEPSIPEKKQAFRIAKNFKSNFWVELGERDIKKVNLQLKETDYNYLEATIAFEGPIFFIEKGEPIWFEGLGKASLTGEKPELKVSNFILEKESSVDFDPLNLEPLKSERGTQSALILKKEGQNGMKKGDLLIATSSFQSKESLVADSAFEASLFDTRTLLIDTPPTLPSIFEPTTFEEEKIELTIPNQLLSSLANHSVKKIEPSSHVREPFAMQGETNYLQSPLQRIFCWARYILEFNLDCLKAPIHSFCEYASDWIDPVEEKVSAFLSFLSSKLDVAPSLSLPISVATNPVSLVSTEQNFDKTTSLGPMFLSLGIVEIAKTFKLALSTKETQSSLISREFLQHEVEEEKIILPLSEKLEKSPADKGARFLVFHHPVFLPKERLLSQENKLRTFPKETGFTGFLGAFVENTDQTSLLFSRFETVSSYFPSKVPGTKSHLEEIFPKSILLSHIDVLYPGFIKISVQKETLLELFDANTEMLLSDKDRFDFLPGQKFTSSITLEHKKKVAFEPLQNEVCNEIVIDKIQVELPVTVQQKILKDFQSNNLKLFDIPSINRSLTSLTGTKMLNQQMSRLYFSIDSFNKIAMLSEDVSKEFQIKASGATLSVKEGYGIEIELELLGTSKPSILDQEILFILDGSRNTPAAHFEIYKTAILRSLKSFSPATRFNIYFTGKNLIKLFDQPMGVSQDKQILAKRFLDQLESFQGVEQGLLLKTCTNLIPEEDDTKLTSLILLCDSVKPIKQLTYLEEAKKIVTKNRGNLQIITATMQQKENQDLKFISLLGSGESFIFPSESSFVRKFGSMIRQIKYPYLTNLSITPLTDGVEIIPNNQMIHPIFINKALRFYAVRETNEPFSILIQGMCDGKIFQIRKEIRTISNESIRAKMKQELLQKRAAIGFESYIKKQDSSKLEETNKRLELFDIRL